MNNKNEKKIYEAGVAIFLIITMMMSSVASININNSTTNISPNKPCNPVPFENEVLYEISSDEADIDDNGIIEWDDFVLVHNHLGEEVNPPGSKPWDVDFDGLVTKSDLNLVAYQIYGMIRLYVDISDPDDDILNVSFYWEDGTLIDTHYCLPSTKKAYVWAETQLDKQYSWYAVADDGQNTATSDVFSFYLDGNIHPDKPCNPSPSDGEILYDTTSLELSVEVSDQDGDSMDVSFYSDLDADINRDGIIDQTDIDLLEDHWQETGDPGWIREDINKDGIVDILDATLIHEHINEITLIDSDTVSGSGIAYVNWEDLTYNKIYSWYAVADDGQNTATSDIFKFKLMKSSSTPEIDLKIQDSTAKAEVEISNSGDGDATNIDWSISVNGLGFKRRTPKLKIELLEEGTIDLLPSGSRTTIDTGKDSLGYNLGFVKISVTAKIKDNDGITVKEKSEEALAMILMKEVYVLRSLR